VTTVSRAVALLLCVTAVHPAAAPGRERCTVVLGPGRDLQKEIDRLPADGVPATVCLRAGEFRLRRFVSIARDRVVLRGAGRTTVLRLAEGTESPVVVVGDYAHATPPRAVSDVTIEQLRIVGGGRGGSEFLRGHPHITNSAVVVRAGRRVAIRHLEVTACRSACILTERDSGEVTIEHSTVGDSVWDGISLNRTSGARLVGNAIRDNTAAGITAEHLVDSVLEDNVVSGNRTHGLYLSDSSRNIVAGNRFAANVLSGVFVTCAIRYRAPVVQCWNDSMARENVFTRNEFVGNRVGFIVAADGAADCMSPGFVPNLSRGDLFAHNPSQEPDWATYGGCLRYAGSPPAD
jgi:parallel beta-helix repeat protein